MTIPPLFRYYSRMCFPSPPFIRLMVRFFTHTTSCCFFFLPTVVPYLHLGMYSILVYVLTRNMKNERYKTNRFVIHTTRKYGRTLSNLFLRVSAIYRYTLTVGNFFFFIRVPIRHACRINCLFENFTALREGTAVFSICSPKVVNRAREFASKTGTGQVRVWAYFLYTKCHVRWSVVDPTSVGTG